MNGQQLLKERSLLAKYKIDERVIPTRKQRRAVVQYLNLLDRQVDVDALQKKARNQLNRSYAGFRWYQKLACNLSFIAMLGLLQGQFAHADEILSSATDRQLTVQTQHYIPAVSAVEQHSTAADSSVTSVKPAIQSLHLLANQSTDTSYQQTLSELNGDEFFVADNAILTVIDPGIENWGVLADAVQAGEVLLLKDDVAPLEQIIAKLKTMGNVKVLNILSHGNDGEIYLSGQRISASNLAEHAQAFSELGALLTEDGQLQLFGCDVAKSELGKNFITELASLTGADVAGSVNVTGSGIEKTNQPSDWELEYFTGNQTIGIAQTFNSKRLLAYNNVLQAVYTFEEDGYCYVYPYYSVNTCPITVGSDLEVRAQSLDPFLSATVYSNYTLNAQGTGAVPAGSANGQLWMSGGGWGSAGRPRYIEMQKTDNSDFTPNSVSVRFLTYRPSFTPPGQPVVDVFEIIGLDSSNTPVASIKYNDVYDGDSLAVNFTNPASSVYTRNNGYFNTVPSRTISGSFASVRKLQFKINANFFGLDDLSLGAVGPVNNPPVNNIAPAISGTATVGNILVSSTGAWTDADGDTLTYSYQWYRADDNSGTNLAAIAGATTASRTLTSSDAHKYLRVVVTANDGNGGTQTATSAYTAIQNSAPVNSVVPTISGTATVGNVLSTTNGTWSDADGDSRTYSYQWYRADDNIGTNVAAIAGATTASYTLTTSDTRKYLRVVVMANDGRGGITSANSTYTQITNSAPVNSTPPSISGITTVGNALSTTNGTWTDADGDSLSYSYQWYRADDNSGTNLALIAGATSASYTLTTSDAHKYLRVVVTANDGYDGVQTANSGYTQVMNSAPTDIILSNTSVNQSSGVNAVVGTLNAVDPDGDTSFTYSLVMGIDDTNNGDFNIMGSTLRLNNASLLAAAGYSVRIGSNDGNGGFFEKAFTVTVVDDVIPTVMSITPASGAIASDTSVSFTVTFSEPVSGVSVSNFALTNTGSVAGTITNVSTTGSTSVVTVTGISGVGTLRVDLNAGTNISDAAGNVIAAGFNSGTAHTVEVLVAPDAPTIGTATGGDGQATISFSAPANDGGAAINGYTVTSIPGNITASGSGSPITVTGLTNGTAYAFTVTATNSVGESIASQPSNSVTPGLSNQTPAISGTPAVSVKQGIAYSFIPTATDADGDTLTFSITNKPSWASFNAATGALTGTPVKANVGVTTGIVISVSDGSLSASLPAFNLEVVNVNEAPVAVDDVFTLPFSAAGVYVLDVLANDSDPDGDTLSITHASTSIGTVAIADSALRFTAPENFSGTVRLEYRISDGEFSAQANVLLTIDGTNPLAPVISGVDDIRVNASGLFTKVDLGVITAKDVNGNRVAVTLVNGAPVFKSGAHEALWQATDSNGVSSSVTQSVKVDPQVSVGKSRQVTNHSLVTVEVMLNGDAPDYPVMLPYTVAGTAALAEHDLSDGYVEITSGMRGSLSFNVFANVSNGNDKTIAIALDNSLNLARNGTAIITVTEANLAPEVVLTAEQQGSARLLVAKDGGEVRVVSQVTDPNGDNVSLSWSSEPVLVNSSSDATVFAFDPASVSNGVYQITLEATDTAASPLSGSAAVLLVVRDSLPALGNEDSNGNLIPDSVEGLGDSNGNGIPDYLDPGFDCNVMVEQLAQSSRFLTEAEPGICISRGRVALESNSGGLELFTNQLQLMEPDTQARPIGGVFDFVLSGLPVQGDSYYFVVPQRAAIPEGAVYRKFTEADGWKNFVQNSSNQLFSAPGEQGYCPAPGDALWQPGLTTGHWCVQLLIEDGGPNDADGTVNGRIVDPGGVSVMLNGNTFPVAENDSYSVMWNQMHVLSVLDNDSDADGDTLTITSASALFGAVVISDDGQQLEYTPQLDYLGTDTVTYSISDGLGGSATAQASVTVYENRAPVVSGVYTATTNNNTAIELQVLSVVTDADGDTLTVTAASAQQGSVSIVNGQLIRYTPPAGYTGTDVVSFTVSDGRGGLVTGVANVTVTAIEVIRVDNKSSGGALGIIAGVFLGLLAFCRRHKISVLVAALVSLFSAATMADEQWSIEAQVGQSKARLSEADVARTLPAGAEILAYDRRDTSWGVGVNFRLAEKLWLQGHYVDLGSATVSIGGAVTDADAFHRAVSKHGALLVEGVKTGLAYSIAQSDSGTLSLQVQAGVFSWWGERESRQDSNVLKADISDTDVYWGLQGAYRLTEKGGVTVGFNRYHLEGNKVDNISVGLRWYF